MRGRERMSPNRLSSNQALVLFDQPCCRRVEDRVSLAKSASVVMMASWRTDRAACTPPLPLSRQPPPTRFHRPQNTRTARLFAAVGLAPSSGRVRASVTFAFLRRMVFPHVIPPCHSSVFVSLWNVGHRSSHPSSSIPLLVPFAATHSHQQRTLSWQFDDLDSALVASVDHMEQSNLSSLEAASRDSELVVLQVCEGVSYSVGGRGAGGGYLSNACLIAFRVI